MTTEQKMIVVLLLILAVAAALLAYFINRRAPLPPSSPGQMPAGGARSSARSSARRVLVLDLDETLVHTPDEGRGETIERPYVREFLGAVAASFDEVVAFTAGTRGYASPILDRLDPGGRVFGRRFYRESCSVLPDVRGGGFVVVKDLRLLGEEDLSRVRLVDNTPSTYSMQPLCGVPIESFYGDPSDRALPELLPKLLAIR